MNDKIVCMNCGFSGVVEKGDETCPKCRDKGCLSWADEKQETGEPITVMQNKKLYYHKTDGGAEYLCTQKVPGTKGEGDLHGAIIRLDGGPVWLSGGYAAAPELLAFAEATARTFGADTMIGREARAALSRAKGE